MLSFIPQNEEKTVFMAVKELKSDDCTKQGAIIVGEFIPSSCVVAYCNKHY